MIRAGLQSKALSDAGMSSLLDQIRYKADWYGTQIIEADQWYPSSKTCSGCGVVNGDLVREPEWDCPDCGAHHDRNENAARNLRKLALLAVGEDVTLLDGEALAGDDTIAGETAPAEGRTRPTNRVGGGLAAPVLPHHRTYSAYPAVSSTVSTGATTRQGSFPFRHRGRWLLLAHPSSGSAFTRDAGAHGLLPPFKKGELLGRALLPLYAHRVLLTGSLQ